MLYLNTNNRKFYVAFFLTSPSIDWMSKVLLLNEAIIGSAESAHSGKDLFVSQDQKKHVEVESEKWSYLIPHPSFDSYMSYSYFKDFCCFLPEI